jgi:hypothetical protein
MLPTSETNDGRHAATAELFAYDPELLQFQPLVQEK